MALPPFPLDHFKFYETDRYQVGAEVRLRGQFDEMDRRAYVSLASHFANPVSKNDEPMHDRNHHLTAYEIFGDPEPQRVVQIENQFGNFWLYLDQPALLLVPTYKVEPTMNPPEHLDHFKAYRVSCGKRVDRYVRLVDQFGADGTRVETPLYFCVPVEKLHQDKRTPIENPAAHLTIYSLYPRDYDLERRLEDQFLQRPARIGRSTMLGVPTLKASWHPA